MEHPYFGSLPDASDDLRWERRVDLAGRAIPLDMTSYVPVTRAQLDAASAFPSALPRFDATARGALTDESEGRETVDLYMEHHLSVLPAATVESLFATTSASSITRELFLSRLVLKRVGLNPADEARTAVFDYTLDGGVTDYLVVVTFDARGEITCIDMES